MIKNLYLWEIMTIKEELGSVLNELSEDFGVFFEFDGSTYTGIRKTEFAEENQSYESYNSRAISLEIDPSGFPIPPKEDDEITIEQMVYRVSSVRKYELYWVLRLNEYAS